MNTRYAGKYQSLGFTPTDLATELVIHENQPRSTVKYPSRVTPGGGGLVKSEKKYTGSSILGIGTMHKSNSVPIFSQSEAVDIATMRRN